MIKILVVDDEKPICDLIDLNLSASGYQCRTVQDLSLIHILEKDTRMTKIVFNVFKDSDLEIYQDLLN